MPVSWAPSQLQKGRINSIEGINPEESAPSAGSTDRVADVSQGFYENIFLNGTVIDAASARRHSIERSGGEAYS
jgi:hypothetical protein